MFIEILEPRIAPSGVVDVIYTSKSMTIKDLLGDDSTLAIVGSTAGSITITPDGTTALRINGSDQSAGIPITLPFFTGSVSVAMGGGADTVTMSGHFVGAVKVDLGAGNNLFTLDSTDVSGEFSVKGGAEADGLQFIGGNSFAKSFTANLGNGGNNLFAGLTSLTVGKNLTLQGGTEFNAMIMNFENVHVGGNVLFAGKGTNNQLGIQASETVTIGGSITMSSIAPLDGESVFILSGNEGLLVGGNVTMKSTDTDHVVFGMGSLSGTVHVTGRVNINVGKLAGVNALSVTAGETLFIGKSLTILTSNEMRPEVRGTSAAGPSFIGGAVTIKGGHSATIAMDGTIAGKVNVAIDGSHPNPVALTSATADGTLRILGAVNVSTSTVTGNGATLVDNVFAESSVTIKDGAGTRLVSVQDSLIRGALTIDTGGGADTVRLEATGDPGNLHLLSALKIVTGAGLDVILIGGNDPGTGVTFAIAKIFVDGGADLANYAVGMASLVQGTPVLKNVIIE
jgi:hypothetical protein